MGLLTKLLGLVAFGKGISEKLILRHLISGLVTAVALAIVAAMMVGVLLFGALYTIFRVFINMDFNPDMALLWTALIAIAITVGVIVKLVIVVKSLFDMPKRIAETELTPVSRMAFQASNVMDSFVEGIMTGKNHKNFKSRY